LQALTFPSWAEGPASAGRGHVIAAGPLAGTAATHCYKKVAALPIPLARFAVQMTTLHEALCFALLCLALQLELSIPVRIGPRRVVTMR
jgi:hypothetical protein